jgi:hypothetical protein
LDRRTSASFDTIDSEASTVATNGRGVLAIVITFAESWTTEAVTTRWVTAVCAVFVEFTALLRAAEIFATVTIGVFVAIAVIFAGGFDTKALKTTRLVAFFAILAGAAFRGFHADTLHTGLRNRAVVVTGAATRHFAHTDPTVTALALPTIAIFQTTIGTTKQDAVVVVTKRSKRIFAIGICGADRCLCILCRGIAACGFFAGFSGCGGGTVKTAQSQHQ